MMGGFYEQTIKETALELEDIIAQGERGHHCIVCWITGDRPCDFSTPLELQLHRIARHGQETDSSR